MIQISIKAFGFKKGFFALPLTGESFLTKMFFLCFFDVFEFENVSGIGSRIDGERRIQAVRRENGAPEREAVRMKSVVAFC